MELAMSVMEKEKSKKILESLRKEASGEKWEGRGKYKCESVDFLSEMLTLTLVSLSLVLDPSIKLARWVYQLMVKNLI